MGSRHLSAAQAHEDAAVTWEAVAAGAEEEAVARTATRRAYAISAHPDADTGGDFDDLRISRLDAASAGPLARAAQHRFEAENHKQTEINEVEFS